MPVVTLVGQSVIKKPRPHPLDDLGHQENRQRIRAMNQCVRTAKQLRVGPCPPNSSQTPMKSSLVSMYREVTDLEERMAHPPFHLPDLSDEVYSALKLKAEKHSDPHSLSILRQEMEGWQSRIDIHDQHAQTIRQILRHVMDPRLDGTLRIIPGRYCLTSRLWVLSFYKILEALRKASFSSTFAFDLLQDRLRDTYDFYNDLLQDASLLPFKSLWCEALGDLSKFHGVVVTMRVIGTGPVGAACHSDLETKMEALRWGEMAEEWYLAGLRENPGSGKLHHLVGLLFRQHEQGFGALRALFHFSKSTIVQHPFQTSHESMLQLWSPAVQERRRMGMHCAKFKATDIFLFLQGLLFRGEFSYFNTALSCFIERLKVVGVEEEEWAMMAAISISSILDFGRSNPTCLDNQSPDGTSPTQQSGNRRKRVDLSAGRNGVQSYAIQLTCCTLSIAVQQQLQPSSSRQNPYIPLILTFLSTVQPQPKHLSQYIPREQLDVFLSACVSRSAHFEPTSSLYTPFEENYYLGGMQWAEDIFDADPNEHLSSVRGFEVSWGVIRRALFPEERPPRPHPVKVGAHLKSLG